MFDLNTLRLVAMLSFMGFVIVTMMLWRFVPQQGSMKYWAASSLLITIGLLLLGLRSHIPDFVSIVIANTVLTLGVGFMYVAACMLLGVHSWMRVPWYGAGLALLICMAAPGLTARVAAMSVLFASYFSVCSYLFWFNGDDGDNPIKRIAALIFATGAVLFAYRVFNPPVQVFSSDYVIAMSLMEAVPYLYLLLLSMGLPLTLMMIVSTRLQSQRSVAIEREEEALNELMESEFLWKFAIEASGDGLWDWNVPREKVFYSRRWKELLGYADVDIGDGLDEWDKRIHPDDKAGTMSAVSRHFEGLTPNYSYEHRLLCKDGHYKWIMTRGLVVSRDDQGKPLRVIGTHTDISALKLQEAYIKYRNQILEMLANGAPLKQVMLEVVLGLEAIHPEMLCSILLLDDSGKYLADAVAPHLPDFYNEAIAGVEIGVGQGSCGTAAATGECVIVADIATHPYWQNFRLIAARAGLASCWSQPIKSSSRQVLGTFAIYHREIHEPTTADIKLIEECADLISIAIGKHAAEVRLKDREKQLELVLEASQLGFWDWDIEKNKVVRNERWATMLGYRLDDIEFSVKQWIDFIHPDDQAAAWNSIQACLEGASQVHSMEYRMRCKGGGYKWVLDQAQVVEWDANQKAVRMCGTHTDITERKLMEEQIRHQALYDRLTELPNRYLFEDRLRLAMIKSKRTGHYAALMFLDLDNFKPLNDSYGHAVGDLLLIEVASRLKRCVREADTVARIGGDEFVIQLEQLDTDKVLSRKEAEVAALKIGHLLAEPYLLKMTTKAGETMVEHHCTASIGVTLFSGNKDSEKEIMRRADNAMYRAKDAGRNRIQFYQDDEYGLQTS